MTTYRNAYQEASMSAHFVELGLALLRLDVAQKTFNARVVASIQPGSPDAEMPVSKAREWPEYAALAKAEEELRQARRRVERAAREWVSTHCGQTEVPK